MKIWLLIFSQYPLNHCPDILSTIVMSKRNHLLIPISIFIKNWHISRQGEEWDLVPSFVVSDGHLICSTVGVFTPSPRTSSSNSISSQFPSSSSPIHHLLATGANSLKTSLGADPSPLSWGFSSLPSWKSVNPRDQSKCERDLARAPCSVR